MISESSLGLRGAAWNFSEGALRASYRFSYAPSLEGFNVGFRVAIVPEPAGVGLTALGGALLLLRRRGIF